MGHPTMQENDTAKLTPTKTSVINIIITMNYDNILNLYNNCLIGYDAYIII